LYAPLTISQDGELNVRGKHRYTPFIAILLAKPDIFVSVHLVYLWALIDFCQIRHWQLAWAIGNLTSITAKF